MEDRESNFHRYDGGTSTAHNGPVIMNSSMNQQERFGKRRKIGFVLFSSGILVANVYWLEISTVNIAASIVFASALFCIFVYRNRRGRTRTDPSNSASRFPASLKLTLLSLLICAAFILVYEYRRAYIEAVILQVWALFGAALYLFAASVHTALSPGDRHES